MKKPHCIVKMGMLKIALGSSEAKMATSCGKMNEFWLVIGEWFFYSAWGIKNDGRVFTDYLFGFFNDGAFHLSLNNVLPYWLISLTRYALTIIFLCRRGSQCSRLTCRSYGPSTESWSPACCLREGLWWSFRPSQDGWCKIFRNWSLRNVLLLWHSVLYPE